jgi:hypothetical protein
MNTLFSPNPSFIKLLGLFSLLAIGVSVLVTILLTVPASYLETHYGVGYAYTYMLTWAVSVLLAGTWVIYSTLKLDHASGR